MEMTTLYFPQPVPLANLLPGILSGMQQLQPFSYREQDPDQNEPVSLLAMTISPCTGAFTSYIPVPISTVTALTSPWKTWAMLGQRPQR